MDSMDIDPPPESAAAPVKPRDRIVRRLAQHGVPGEVLERHQAGLVDYVKGSRLLIPELVSATLPTDEEVAEALQQAKAAGSKKTSVGMKGRFRESMVWLQWLMFEGEPAAALKFLSDMSVGQRGVCAAVWGNNDIAYRCRTCEYDPTCAICVPCFQNGNHEGHDYSVIYTGGGCCDCGDVTAWKREGFCSRHKGAEQIQPLPLELAHSVGPVLDALFICWKNKLLSAEAICQGALRSGDRAIQVKKVANELTFVTVEMLLEFCKYSESLLSFVSRRLCSSVGLLEILVKAERYLSEAVVKKLHELLLKLLGEPVFKYEFAKVFLDYYPVVVNEVIKENNDRAFNKYQLLPTFSVQIFTVPTLTPRLVKEINLLTTLLGCLKDIFIFCAGEDGRLQVTKWGNLYELTIRVVEDIRFVMSHAEVPKYVTQEQRDILKTWIKLVGFVQGINPQKRETGIHIEEENDNMHIPFGLCHCISSIHVLLVNGAFSVELEEKVDETLSSKYKQDIDMDDTDGPRHAKVGRLSEESSAGSPTGRSGATSYTPMSVEVKSEPTFPLLIPPSVTFLTYECLRAIENSLGVDNTSGVDLNTLSPNSSNISSSNFLALRKTLSKIRKGKSIFSRLTSSNEDNGKQGVSSANSGLRMSIDSESGLLIGQDSKPMVTGENDSANGPSSTGDDCAMEAECAVELDALRVLSLANWPDIYYDVSSQEISIHIPLHRLLALLLQKALGRCYGESGMPNMTSAKFSDFFGYILGNCHPYGFSAFAMEHPLRTRVFCAQVHAGMWRKNGDAALLSSECYRTVRWSGLDLELDLFLLQCCASLAPADDYVSRILERFGLSSYLLLNSERSNEYEPVLVQEMLTLLIQIIKERRFCGLSRAESVKRELIHKLVVGDATHSQLVKSLPRDLSKFDQLQDILDTIAQYSNPSGINQGKYSLRWTYWKELDLYHPRWSLRDLQVAEERYQQFCSVSAFTAQLPKWTSIYPPLKGIAAVATCRVLLQIIRAVLFHAVFTDKLTESRAPDSVLLSALHLLSLALNISCQSKESGDLSCFVGDPVPVAALAVEEIDEALLNGAGTQSLLSLLVALMRMHRKENMDTIMEAGSCNLSSLIESLLKKFAEIDSGCMRKLQQLAPEVINQLPQSNGGKNVTGSASDSEKRKAKARERQAAILEKMRAEQSKFMASIDTTEDESSNFEQEISDQDAGNNVEEPAQDVCSLCHDSNSQHPVSFLVLLQKSRLLSFVDRAPPSWELGRPIDKEHASAVANKLTDQSETSSSEENSSRQLAQLVQDAVNEFAVNGQPAEIDAFLEFIKARFPSVRNIQVPSKANERKERNTHAFEKLEEDMYLSIRRDVQDHLLQSDFMNEENNSSAAEGSPGRRKGEESIVLGKYIAALSRESSEVSSTSDNPPNDRIQLASNTQLPAYDGLGPAGCDGIFVSSCGHAVHQGCLDRYLESVKERFVRRIVFEGGHIVDPDQGEFLCPVCRRLANSVLPTLAGDVQKIWKQPMITGSSCIRGPLVSDEMVNPSSIQQALCILQSAAHEVGNVEILKALPLKRDSVLRPNLDSVARVLSKMYFTGKLDRFSKSARLSHTMTTMWDTLKYSIASTEIAARSGRTYMTTIYSIDSLYREFESSSGFILSLMLRIVQNMRSKSTLLLLQRFRGIQLFAESICSGVSGDYPNDISQRGNMLSILKHGEKEGSYAEIQFWKRASDPILSRDPFSSLMWALFCLPCPFLSCEESFLSLVHLFYLVCLAQGIITYCGKYHSKISGLGLDDCLITDIFRAMGESKCAQQYFVSNYIDSSRSIEDTLCSFSFPYLRRCALLWKLLNSSAPKPFCDRGHVLDGSSHANNDFINSTLELTEIQKLQNMFKVPSIDAVLKDNRIRSLVSKWFSHFCKDFECRQSQSLVHSTPAVPFKLMNLPHVYQDLLQRYIKQHCVDCKSPLEEPALCLLCGRLCSPSWKSCCRESGCQTHAMACGAGIGVFLLIRRTTILLQRSARQAPWPSLYLDAFGEEDVEMQRGKPLYLNEERYAALNYMVASHGLDRSSKVLGQTTIGSFFLV